MSVLRKLAMIAGTAACLAMHGLGIKTLSLCRRVPNYDENFRRLWERHKNPISWVCRPFFGLLAVGGLSLHNWAMIGVGVFGIATSWFWFPKPKRPPQWAENFIDKEFETIQPSENPWGLRRVAQIILIIAAVAIMCAALWLLPHPYNWLGLIVLAVGAVYKTIWSARLHRSVLGPILMVNLVG